jgi:hypothetical protein
MQIKLLTSDFAERYESFVLAQPESLLFQSWRYQSLLIELLGCKQQGLLALDDNGEILAALPLMSMEGKFGTFINSLPFFGTNGGFIGGDQLAHGKLGNFYNNFIHNSNIATSTIIENPLTPINEDEIIYDYIDRRIGQLTRLPNNEDIKESLMNSFHYKTRNMIRKAEKLGVQVEIDNKAISFLADTHLENMRDISGLAKPRIFFDLLSKYFKPDVDFRIYIARLDGEIVAALLVFFYNHTVEYYTPVIRKENRDSQALSALIFFAMCDAAEGGFIWWNWGGTWLSQTGVYRFKSRWGTQDFQYRYFTKVNNQKILKVSHKELLENYPFFYSVPFSVLTK